MSRPATAARRCAAMGLLVILSTGCVTTTEQVHSTTVSHGTYLAQPSAETRYVRVLLSSAEGRTQAVVAVAGRCALMEVGENHRTVERHTEMTTFTVVVAALFAASAMVVYVAPDGRIPMGAGSVMLIGTGLLAAGAVAYGIPAIAQGTTTRTLPPRDAERAVKTVECPITPVANVEIVIRGPNREQVARTDERGVALLEGEIEPGSRVFIDGRRVTHVRRHEP